jgi:hypothetical protein
MNEEITAPLKAERKGVKDVQVRFELISQEGALKLGSQDYIIMSRDRAPHVASVASRSFLLLELLPNLCKLLESSAYDARYALTWSLLLYYF